MKDFALPPYASPAATILAQHFGAGAVGTYPLLGSYSASLSERVGVSVRWAARSSERTPGLVALPVDVRPIPGTGTFLVSYRQASEESVLLALPAVVDRIIALARSGDYGPRG